MQHTRRAITVSLRTNVHKGLFKRCILTTSETNQTSFCIRENITTQVETTTVEKQKSIDELVRMSLSRMPKATPYDLMQPDVIQGKIYMEKIQKEKQRTKNQ